MARASPRGQGVVFFKPARKANEAAAEGKEVLAQVDLTTCIQLPSERCQSAGQPTTVSPSFSLIFPPANAFENELQKDRECSYFFTGRDLQPKSGALIP